MSSLTSLSKCLKVDLPGGFYVKQEIDGPHGLMTQHRLVGSSGSTP